MSERILMAGAVHRPLTRRRLLAGAAAVALLDGCVDPRTVPLGKRPRSIGVLSSGATIAPEGLAAFRDGMREEGFADPDYVLEIRPAEGRTDRLVPLAKELVALDVDVIVATTTGSTQAARAVTASIPIVMLASHDPVEAGVVSDLARPGGNVTGLSLMGGPLMPKQLELLREAAPVARMAYLTPDVPSPAPGYPSVTDVFTGAMREHAGAARIDVRVFSMRDPSEFDALVAALAAETLDAIFLIESAVWTGPQVQRVADLSIRRRLPSISGQRPYVRSGLLMSYGEARTNIERWPVVSRFVAKILRGAKPGDLPIERPTRFELVINGKTAAALGLALPRALLDRAATVIQ